MSFAYCATSGKIVEVADASAPAPDPVTASAFAAVPPERLGELVSAVGLSRLTIPVVVAVGAFAALPTDRVVDFVAALDLPQLTVLGTCITARVSELVGRKEV